jgi:hypothetical protein
MRPRAIRGGLVGVALVGLVLPGCAARQYPRVSCRGHDSSFFVLEAQAVPSATFIPCIEPLAAGWSYGGSEVRSGLARIWLNSDRAGPHAVELALTRTCDASGALPIRLATAPPGLRRYDEPAARHPGSSISYYVFTGGCVTYRFAFARQSASVIFDQADHALGFTPRSVYVGGVRHDAGLTLCGAEAPPCPGYAVRSGRPS